ncbi:MAG: hypothetical protein R3C68_06820 [Myxococcota bacterium]
MKGPPSIDIDNETSSESKAEVSDKSSLTTQLDPNFEEAPVLPHNLDAEPTSQGNAGPDHTSQTTLNLDALLAELQSDAENPEPPPGAETSTGASQSSGTQPTVVITPQDTDIPPLVLSDAEPTAIPSVGASAFADEETMATLHRLAGGGVDATDARAALTAALTGQAYDARAIPEAKVMALGVARVLVNHGIPVKDLVNAILAFLQR